MSKLFTTLALLVTLLLPTTALAWDGEGHMAVAAIAYKRLKPATRAKVDALMDQHPDLNLLKEGLSESDPNFHLFLFMRAATWPDLIKSDQHRFANADEPGPNDPPLEPGFPFMINGRHWHFFDTPFAIDNVPPEPARRINALVKINLFRSHLGDTRMNPHFRAYELAWLEHLIGDVHQPLHATSRFSLQHQNGDGGGNSFLLHDPARNLHTYWDDLIGKDDDPAIVSAVAEEIESNVSVPAAKARITTTATWINESFIIAKTVVYTVGDEGTPHPTPSDDYHTRAVAIARERIKLGGIRLANLLNAQLR